MSYPSWPSGVPSEPEQDGYAEDFAANLATFEPDVGPPTSWRRSTLDSGKIDATIIMTTAERDLFKTFFRTTLKDGSTPFLWTNPAYDAEATHIFDPKTPPQFRPIGASLWRVRLSIIRIN